MTPQHIEQTLVKIADMDRDGLIRMLRSLHCPFQLDFTDDFLNSVSIERLRHIVLAASLHTDRKTAGCV